MNSGFSFYISSLGKEVSAFIEMGTDYFQVENEEVLVVFYGILLNKKKLLQDFALASIETLVLERYRKEKENIINLFEGEFRGFIFDKKKQKYFVFTNRTATQKVFYGKFEDQLFIDTSLVRLVQNLKKKKVLPSPNIDGIYQLLCFGGLLENATQISGVYKLLDGHFLEVNCAECALQPTKYADVMGIPYFAKSKEKAFSEMNDLFSEAVKMEYEKDAELGKNSLALLSGGLDSRVALMYALKQNFLPENIFCFSQSGYFDESISRKIAEDYSLHYEFIPLDGGSFLKKIDQLTTIAEGAVFFTGGIHVQHAIDKMRYENFGVFHSGQIGDGVLGGFNPEPRPQKPGTFKIVNNPAFLSKVQTDLQIAGQKYERQEDFLLRNLVFNQTVLGAQVLQQKAYQTSPFMNRDFLTLALSLPEAWKWKHHFYIEWINKYCAEATKYRWERTLMKPNATWKTNFGDQVVKRTFKILNDKILKTPAAASMYPYQYYYNTSSALQNFYQQYYLENIWRLEAYPELQHDIEILFSEQNFFRKAQAVNILAIFKLFFAP